MRIKNIYLIRHGETDWNKSHRFQGQTDVELNDTGREQAQKVRPYIQSLQIESVYSSPLSRAFQTAQIATQDLKLSIQKDDRLKETNIGKAEGLTLDEILAAFGPDCITKWRSYDERLLDYHFSEGESKRQLMFRARQALLEIAQNTNRNSIAVFSHGMFMRALTHVFGDGLPWDLQVFANGSIHHFIWSEDRPESLIYQSKIN